MGSNWEGYLQTVDQLMSYCNFTTTLEVSNSLSLYIDLALDSDEETRFSKPMVWIGIYIAAASLFCSIPMVVDLLHGLRNRKQWFPCKYFTLNAVSLTVIAVAMKLPMDLNNPMPGSTDQAAKLGSMAFMCTMMANLLPSLSTMDNKELLTNIVALGVLVITLVVNVCIQITTGVIQFATVSTIYVALLLMLLIIHTSSSLAIPKFKQMLELKYQAAHQTDVIDQEFQQPGKLTVEKLKQFVSNYWIMAATGNPQFMTACSATSSATGVICAISTFIHILFMFVVCVDITDNKSDYKSSMSVIIVTQLLGISFGSIAPISRCFASLSFKLSIKWIWNNFKVFDVESFWTEKLYDWKQSNTPFPYHTRKYKVVIQKLKILILCFYISSQKVVVVACKIIGLIPMFYVIWVLYCFRSWKWLKAMFSASGNVSGKRPEELKQNEVVSPYLLQFQDDMELAERTLTGISKSLNRLIQKAEKQQPNNLMKLLEVSRGFEGVEKYNSHKVPSLLAENFVDCWSLPLVTLTTIAISLPNIQKDIVDTLLSSVSEGLVYVTLVEESLNATDDYVSVQKAAKTLWLEVEIYHKWLGNKLQKPDPQVNTVGQILQWFRDTAKTLWLEVDIYHKWLGNKLQKPDPQGNTVGQILQWFRDTAKKMVTEVENTDIGVGGRNDDSMCRSISANSMYRITETILLSYHANIEEVSQKELFEQLSSMISDILAACLTNLPRVIVIKCHTNEIEKRVANVHGAAQLLGETMQIISSLEDRELPRLNPDELAFIDKWSAYLKHPFP